MIFILNLLNFVSLMMIKKEGDLEKASRKSLRDILKNTLQNKNFKNVLTLNVIWEIAKFMTIGFMGIYKTKNLAMSIAMIQGVSMIAMLVRMGVTIPFGRLADKRSYAKCMEIAFVVAAIAFLINVFVTPERWWLIIAYTIVFESSQAGIGQNATNICYSYVKEEYIVYALVIKGSIGGVFGFLASLVGGKILDIIQNNNNMIFGVNMHAQQVLSLISFAIVVVAILFDRFVVEKQKVMIQ